MSTCDCIILQDPVTPVNTRPLLFLVKMVDVDQSQEEEILALESIYGNEFKIIDSARKLLELQVSNEENNWWSLTLRVKLPSNYPKEVAPCLEILCECLSNSELEQLRSGLDEIWMDNHGSCILYLWAEKCRQFIGFLSETAPSLQGCNESELEDEDDGSSIKPVCLYDEERESNPRCPAELAQRKQMEAENPINVISGEPITDRKSTFQAHAAHVSSEAQINWFMRKLLENPKVARASHNVMAYRIEKSPNTFLHDNNDDGEKGASSRLMHLLQILDARDVVVVVSRWYGGILLGADRFKHINNCARQLIVSAGFSLERSKKQTDVKTHLKSQSKMHHR